MKEELGILKDIHVGLRDTNNPICWFTVDILSGSFLQIISFEDLKRIITDSNVYKLEDLNNKPCIVEVDNHIVKFVKMK